MLLTLLLVGVGVLFAALALSLRASQREELRKYGVTDEVWEDSRHAEPDTSPFESPSFETVEKGIPGPWEKDDEC